VPLALLKNLQSKKGLQIYLRESIARSIIEPSFEVDIDPRHIIPHNVGTSGEGVEEVKATLL